MSKQSKIADQPSPSDKIMPFSWIEGQDKIKLALKLAYIMGPPGGVLIRGRPGTGKSTIARAFAQMVYGRLPVTLPINATVDRVVGGLDTEKLLEAGVDFPITKQATEVAGTSQAMPSQDTLVNGSASEEKLGKRDFRRKGVLEEAHNGMLYIDEVNLLDDHIVNIILDAVSTSILNMEQEGLTRHAETLCLLVGTMNPEEGSLRSQLLDRFGLVIDEIDRTDQETRAKILRAVIKFDDELWKLHHTGSSKSLNGAREEDRLIAKYLDIAKAKYQGAHGSVVEVYDSAYNECVKQASQRNVVGHRGERTLFLASKAYAVLHAIETRYEERKNASGRVTSDDIDSIGMDLRNLTITIEGNDINEPVVGMTLNHRDPNRERVASKL